MLTRIQFVVVTTLALIALALTLLNGYLVSETRGLQVQANERQVFLQQTAQLELLYRQLVSAIAELATKSNDAQLGGVLTHQGITYSLTPSQPGAATPPAK